MKQAAFSILITAICSSVFLGQNASKTPEAKKGTFTAAQTIEDWNVPGELGLKDYQIYLDTDVFRTGAASGSIKSKSSVGGARQSAFLMQIIKAGNYRGKRLQMSAYIKSEEAEHAALWMRLDAEKMLVLGLDAMDDRPIQGTNDWWRYSIVLDVPVETEQITFGINLKGSGQIWIDDIEFEAVGEDVPTTVAKTAAEFAKSSAKRIEQYKTTNRDDYEKQLEGFLKRNANASRTPSNLGFENE